MPEKVKKSPEQRFIADDHPHVLEARASMSQSLGGVPMVVFDVETTGLRADRGDKIIEIALLRVEPGVAPISFTSVLNPGRPVSDEILALTHISPDEISAAPCFADLSSEIRALLTGAVLVAHNARFDLGFLGIEFAARGETTPVRPVIDTLALAKNRFTFPNNKLGTIVAELGLPVSDNAHRAFADVDMTAQMLQVMIQRMKDQGHIVETIADLMKHTGAELLSIPTVSSAMLHDIRSAVISGEVYTFMYKKSGQRKPQRRQVKLTSFDGVYATGLDMDKEEERQFRLDRMS